MSTQVAGIETANCSRHTSLCAIARIAQYQLMLRGRFIARLVGHWIEIGVRAGSSRIL
jgi:hypothetical protein